MNTTNADTQSQKNKIPTMKQLNTKKIIFDLVAAYDSLLVEYTLNPTAKAKRMLDEYAQHLKNKSQLQTFFINYIDDNNIQDTLSSSSKIRKLITKEIEDKNLIIIDDLIRISRTTPRANDIATGNIISITFPDKYLDALKESLDKALVNQPVHILVPCSNLVLVIELGDHTPTMNNDLRNLVGSVVLTLALENNLTPSSATEQTKFVLK